MASAMSQDSRENAELSGAEQAASIKSPNIHARGAGSIAPPILKY
jgi:hypothetical protein